jgi:hypothetical protein
MAVTFDFGQCPACGENNSKSIQFCRACSEALPWAKAAKLTKEPGSGVSLPSMGDVAWGPISVQLLGGVTFLAGIYFFCGNIFGFYLTFRGLGYITMVIGGAIFKAGLAMD